jgi:hypothetical protein
MFAVKRKRRIAHDHLVPTLRLYRTRVSPDSHYDDGLNVRSWHVRHVAELVLDDGDGQGAGAPRPGVCV